MLDEQSTFRSLYWPVAIILALLLGLLWLLGYGPGGQACRPAPVVSMPAPAAAPAAVVATTPPAVVAAPPAVVAAPPPTTAMAPAALPPAEKVYFAVDKFDVNAESTAKLSKIIDYLKANPGAMAVVSGFHDPTGNKAKNEELALNRARAVRTVLEQAGIPKERVEMAKPVETTGGGAEQESRRVEVSVKA
jgi:outer membrane protein OmpA-like peptidoglycan-associated protein